MRPIEFLGVRKAKKKPGRKLVFSPGFFFAFQTMLRTVRRRKAPAAQERLHALPQLSAIQQHL